MTHSLRVQVHHALCNVSGKGEPKHPLQWNVIILKHIVETSLGAVLSDDVYLSVVFDGGSEELAEIGMVHHSDQMKNSHVASS